MWGFMVYYLQMFSYKKDLKDCLRHKTKHEHELYRLSLVCSGVMSAGVSSFSSCTGLVGGI